MTRLPIAISGLGYTRNVGQTARFVADHTHVVNFFTDWATKYYIFGVEWVGGLQYLTSVAVVAASSASSFIGFHYTYLLKGARGPDATPAKAYMASRISGSTLLAFSMLA